MRADEAAGIFESPLVDAKQRSLRCDDRSGVGDAAAIRELEFHPSRTVGDEVTFVHEIELAAARSKVLSPAMKQFIGILKGENGEEKPIEKPRGKREA